MILRAEAVSKRFGAITALSNVTLEVKRGTIHALIGENGAGKSTLGRIISGVIRPDEGRLFYAGSYRNFHSPQDALKVGITAMDQEANVVPDRSVIQNVFLGAETTSVGFLNRQNMRRRYDRLVQETGLDLPGDTKVGNLPVTEQHKVELMRALVREANVIVMDEPSASFGKVETEKLHRIVRSLVNRGVTVVYVTHFLEEVLRLADTVTVLRNGEVVHTSSASDETTDSLVEAMLGRKLPAMFPDKRVAVSDSSVLLSVRGLTVGKVIKDVSFDVRAGEIVGLAGLVGSGRSELARAVFGAERATIGEIKVSGKSLRIQSPSDAVRAGIAYIPEDRKQDGLVMDASLLRNVSLCHLKDVSKFGWLLQSKRLKGATEVLSMAQVAPVRLSDPMSRFSGGNQQKTLFAKWLFKTPMILIADEPTRGVDVGAKLAIYTILANLAAKGMAILMISSEIEEIIGLSHRALVMRRGCIVAELQGRELTESRIMHAAFGTNDRN